jgi:hypothetical protein
VSDPEESEQELNEQDKSRELDRAPKSDTSTINAAEILEN